jgi:hypothetical protein
MALFPVFNIFPKTPEVRYFGAVPKKPERSPFGETFGHFTSISQGKRAFLWKFLEQVMGWPLEAHDQRPAPDCVAQATALTADILAACEIGMGEREQWIAKANVEMIYAGSRVQIGNKKFGSRPGSHGEWAVKYLQDYGVLHRLPYSDGNNYLNLMGYDPERSQKYSQLGVPNWLEPIARRHPIQTYTTVTNFRELCDALYVGQPAVLSCSYAFPNVRDKDGFTKPYTGRRRKKWHHAWCVAGFIDGSRPGGLLINSHGQWNRGPRKYGQPHGSHFVDAEYLDLLIGEWHNCHAISAYVGHPRRMLNHRLY